MEPEAEEREMEYALLTFSMQTERLRFAMNADKLCQLAAKNGSWT